MCLFLGEIIYGVLSVLEFWEVKAYCIVYFGDGADLLLVYRAQKS